VVAGPALRRDDDAVLQTARIDPLADDLFGLSADVPRMPGGVHVSGVDEVAARLDEGVENQQVCRFVGRPSEDVPTEAEPRDLEICAGQSRGAQHGCESGIKEP
jgi:hypothetical protein